LLTSQLPRVLAWTSPTPSLSVLCVRVCTHSLQEFSAQVPPVWWLTLRTLSCPLLVKELQHLFTLELLESQELGKPAKEMGIEKTDS
jgi:hypothetical protein